MGANIEPRPPIEPQPDIDSTASLSTKILNAPVSVPDGKLAFSETLLQTAMVDSALDGHNNGFVLQTLLRLQAGLRLGRFSEDEKIGTITFACTLKKIIKEKLDIEKATLLHY